MEQSKLVLFIRAAVLLVMISLTTSVVAEEDAVGDVEVMLPWARATAPTAMTGAGYMEVTNHGSVTERLLSASAEVSEVVELHTHIRDGEMMRMVEVETIEIPPGETVSLEPGGLHIMFIGLHAPLVAGTEFPLTLEFEQAGSLEVRVSVRGIDGQPHDHDHEHGHGHSH